MPASIHSAVSGAMFAAFTAGACADPGVTVLHGFNFSDGECPLGRQRCGSDGRIYGSTYAGGTAGLGTV